MSTGSSKKLHHLQRLLPAGLVVDAAWLETKGYSSALRSRYVTNGWLERPVRGTYRRQVALLVQVIPFVAEEACFALKGGTAINLFVRDLPRLSVDIDLTYLPVADRAKSLTNIDAAMDNLKTALRTS